MCVCVLKIKQVKVWSGQNHYSGCLFVRQTTARQMHSLQTLACYLQEESYIYSAQTSITKRGIAGRISTCAPCSVIGTLRDQGGAACK